MNTIQEVHLGQAEVRTAVRDFFHFVQKHWGQVAKPLRRGPWGRKGHSKYFIHRIACREVRIAGSPETLMEAEQSRSATASMMVRR
jgi:hypothetical protein